MGGVGSAALLADALEDGGEGNGGAGLRRRGKKERKKRKERKIEREREREEEKKKGVRERIWTDGQERAAGIPAIKQQQSQ